MTMFIIQSALLLAIAFILGCIVGCVLRSVFGNQKSLASDTVKVAAATTAGIAATSALKRSPAKQPEPAPSMPMPVAAMPKAAETMPKTAPERAKTPAKAKTAPAKPAEAKKSAASTKSAKPAATVAKVAPAANDDLTLIEGIGPVNKRKLNSLGITNFAQIASWSAKEQEDIGAKLEFPGRIEREEWVAQARELMAGIDRKPKGRSGASGAAKPASAKSAAPAGGKTKPGAAQPAKLVDVPAAKPVKAKLETAKAAPVKIAPAKSDAAKPVAAKPAKTQTVGGSGGRPLGLMAAKGGKGDNLTLINGVGNVLEKKLNKLGIFHFEQIAAWSAAEQEWIGKEVGFPGRVQRENWVGESKVLGSGGSTEHAKRVEAGEIDTSRKSRPGEK